MAEEKQEKKSLWSDFKAFINRGNIVDMSVGVIMGSAFGAIVTAFTNILLSVCTWGVPGGLNGLVTVLPALNEAQAGVSGIGQTFANSELSTMAEKYCESMGGTYAGSEAEWIAAVKSLYTQHGDVWTYNQSAVIDWGTFINAIIAFLIIALTLFVILKIFNYLNKKRKDLETATITAIKEHKIEDEKEEGVEEAKAEEEAEDNK